MDSDTGGPTSLPLLRQLYSDESVMGSNPRPPGQLSIRHISVLRTASKSFFKRSASKYSVSIEYLQKKKKLKIYYFFFTVVANTKNGILIQNFEHE